LHGLPDGWCCAGILPGTAFMTKNGAVFQTGSAISAKSHIRVVLVGYLFTFF
jgi:hypothetical protein